MTCFDGKRNLRIQADKRGDTSLNPTQLTLLTRKSTFSATAWKNESKTRSFIPRIKQNITTYCIWLLSWLTAGFSILICIICFRNPASAHLSYGTDSIIRIMLSHRSVLAQPLLNCGTHFTLRYNENDKHYQSWNNGDLVSVYLETYFAYFTDHTAVELTAGFDILSC